MATNDITDLLTGTLSGLRLLGNDTNQETAPSFSVFPNLPIELRLKIFKHTLPPPSTIRVKANVLLSDPTFGLYITFRVSYSKNTTSSFEPLPPIGRFTKGLQLARMTSLLLTTKESREFYLGIYSQSLPSSPNGQGQIRLSKEETVYIDNLPDLLAERAFMVAMANKYRLQDWWSQLDRIAFPYTSFLTIGSILPNCSFLDIVKAFGELKVLNAVVWDGFADRPHTNMGTDLMVDAMKARLKGVKEKMQEKFKDDVDAGYCMPRVEISKDQDWST